MAQKFNFTNEFQDMLLACVVTYPLEFWSYGDIVRPEYFNGVDAFETAFALERHVTKYGKYPNFSTLMNSLFVKFGKSNPDKAAELVDYVAKLIDLDTSDWLAVRDMVSTFAKERAIFNAIKKIHGAQMEGKLEEVDPISEMRAALDVGEDSRKGGLELKRDYLEVIDRATKVTYGARTGFIPFDDIWKTGWAPGWLIVPLAPPKSFKTTFCLNLALKMVGPTVEGDVIYYACEISDELAMMRALYNVSGVTSNDLFENGVEKFKQAAKEGIQRNIGKSRLFFKSFPSKTATIADIEKHAQYLVLHEGAKPKAIIIDYAETVRPMTTGKNIPDWRQQSDIYTSARAMGSKLNCCIIMPDRCNKETVGRKVPNMASFQGSFEKAGVVDIAIGICFTESERLQNKVRYFLFLNRHGPQYIQFLGKIHPELMRMTVDDTTVYIPEDEEDSSHRRGSRHKKVREQIAADEND